MASPTSPVLANDRRSRGIVTIAPREREDDSTENHRRTTNEQYRDMSTWKLPESGFRGQPADNDHDEDGDDSEAESEDGVPTTRATMMGLMNSSKSDVDSETTYSAFCRKHYHDVSSHIRKDAEGRNPQGTLLHAIVQSDIKQAWELWVKFILDVAKRIDVPILQDKAAGGSTCIHVAIEARKAGLPFIRLICTIANDQDLEAAIAAENGRDQSCIDLAIAQLSLEERDSSGSSLRLPSLQILQELTSNASGETLYRNRRMRIQNSNDGIGNLPLHDLVHINLCREWVKRCSLDEANCRKCQIHKRASENYRETYLNVVDVMVEKCPGALRKTNKASQSPFLFHCHTRNKNKTTKDWNQLEFGPSDGVTDGKAKAALPIPNLPKVKDVRPHASTKDDLEATRDKSSVHEKTVKKHKPAEVEICKELAITVSQKLLELCLSQKSFSDVCDSSFGEKFPSSELIFKAAPLTDKTMELHSSLPLEPILACVELGLDEGRVQARSTEGLVDEDRKAREVRVHDLFKWLRDKGVKRIVRLVVYDHPHAPCRDGVVKSCLEGFDIRYLDWNKEDLTVDMLQEVAPNLQELWLNWSGRKSTLFGWCNERYGLRLLKHLGALYVSTGSRWESPGTIDANLKQFKTILAQVENKPTLEVRDAEEAISGSDNRIDRVQLQGVKAGNLWMDAIKVFHESLKHSLDKESVLKKAMNGAVKVAIIDDGVDLGGLTTTKYISGGWYPDRRAPDRGSMNAWYISEKRHGTEMVRLVQRVWPFLNLYIAKLDTTRRVYKSVAASAAEAINKAIENGVNVISMSWTIYQSADPTDDGVAKMKEAMTKAEKYNIIMFCASQDGGFSGHRKPYPASDRNNKTVKVIGSAGPYGERSEYVNPKEVDYLFPGEVAMSDKDICTGSSAATALAAGLAGLILWCCALLEKRHMLEEMSEAVPRTDDAGMMKPPLKRTNSRLAPVANGPQLRMDRVGFQDYDRMYGLFTALRSSTENPLVNIAPILHEAAASDDPAQELIRKCRDHAHSFFEERKTTLA